MTADDVRERLTTKSFGRSLHFYESLDSTNTTAKRLASEGAPEGSVVIALDQKSGRGRQDRTWVSEPGKNLTFTLILRPRIRPEVLGIVSLYASAAVAASVSSLSGREAGCKWPNDVVISGKKISGILCESAVQGNAVDSVVVGIGLNVNQLEFPEDIAAKSTSLALETGRAIRLDAALCTVLGELETLYRPSGAGWPDEVISWWTKRNVILGSVVEGMRGSSRITGVARSVTTAGALLIETEGRMVEFASGDVHLV
ncbi:MAG TPA: biotin--[acetyl-CoA-carboxylase] ligase [Bacteroidota bacterium]|nr:biotin--[acetyl-CoA-carboxylase] ligase [Bacteroidota bacterium]